MGYGNIREILIISNHDIPDNRLSQSGMWFSGSVTDTDKEFLHFFISSFSRPRFSGSAVVVVTRQPVSAVYHYSRIVSDKKLF